jgi:hypothetical protein
MGAKSDKKKSHPRKILPHLDKCHLEFNYFFIAQGNFTEQAIGALNGIRGPNHTSNKNFH